MYWRPPLVAAHVIERWRHALNDRRRGAFGLLVLWASNLLRLKGGLVNLAAVCVLNPNPEPSPSQIICEVQRVKVMRIATGEEEEDVKDAGKNPAAKELGSRGGKARARALSGMRRCRSRRLQPKPDGSVNPYSLTAWTWGIMAQTLLEMNPSLPKFWGSNNLAAVATATPCQRSGTSAHLRHRAA